MSCSFNCTIIKKEIEDPQSETNNIENLNTAQGAFDSQATGNNNKYRLQSEAKFDIEIKLEPDDTQQDPGKVEDIRSVKVEITADGAAASTCTRNNLPQSASPNPVFSSSLPVSASGHTKIAAQSIHAQSWSPPRKSPTPTVIGSSKTMLHFVAIRDSDDIERKPKPGDGDGEVNEQDPLSTTKLIEVEVIVEPKTEPDPLKAESPNHNEGKKCLQSSDNVIMNVDPCDKKSNEKFACSVCKKEYKYKRGLTNHLKTHFPFKLTCNICEETFPNRVKLKNHQKEEHPGVKPFPCPMCGKRYNQKYHLTYHLRVHSGDKPYSCDICKQSFTSKYILTYHLRLHSGDKRFSCDFCEKRFIKKCALTNHLRVHTGDKPFMCDICNKCFSQRSTLTDHLRLHRGERKMFSCEICQKIFYYKSHLNRHLPVHNS